MNSERFQQVKSLFLKVCDFPPDDRKRLLDEHCGHDKALRAAVEKLLIHDADPVSLGDGAMPRAQLEQLFDEFSDVPGEDAADADRHPEAIGNYRILGRLGEGGFGTVYRAEQQLPLRRIVAIKIIKLGMGTSQVIARFEAERQALALMNHPNIARVFHAGATESGRPYFVMELVEGVPITEYCDTHALDLKARLDLFATVCHAVQHAHQKGIIHRDLKPSNVLVALHDHQPAPKVIDFGIARAIDDSDGGSTLITKENQMVGTPEYMSPEQADGRGDIDTRTDVYSLGVLLYELLTGSTPVGIASLSRADPLNVQRLIREQNPPTPSTRVKTLGRNTGRSALGSGTNWTALSRMLRGDLDWIVMKALEKDRARRYETANGLAMDIHRHLQNEPVAARPPTASYRFRKFAQRHRAALVASVAMAVLLLTAVIGTTVALVRATNAERRARQESAVARAVNAFLNQDLLSAVSPDEQGKDVHMRQVLAAAEERVVSRFPDQPFVESAIRLTLGTTYISLGEFDRAERHLERALALRKQTLDSDNLATQEAALALADLRIDQGHYVSAEAMLSESLARLRETQGADHPATVRALYGLGRIQQARGHYEKAAAVFEDSLQRLRKTLGPRDRVTLNVMASLASAYRNLEFSGKAEQLYFETVKAHRLQMGPEHPFTLAAMNDLAIFYQSQGRYDEAAKTFEQVVAAKRRVLGVEHPDTVDSMNGLANLYYVLGRLDEAEGLFLQTLEAQRRILGLDHPRTLTCANSLARVYFREKRYDEAERFCADALEILRHRFGDENPRTITAMSTLAKIYQAQGRLVEAESLSAKVLDLWRRLSGDRHRNTITAMNNLASIYEKQGRLGEAEALLAATVSAGRESLPAGHSFLGSYLMTHGVVLRRLARFEDAEQALLDSHAILVDALGPSHQRTLATTNELVKLYEAWRKPTQADRWRHHLPSTQPNMKE